MRSKIFSLRLFDEMLLKINSAASDYFISASDFIRQAVAKQLNAHLQADKIDEFNWEKLFEDDD